MTPTTRQALKQALDRKIADLGISARAAAQAAGVSHPAMQRALHEQPFDWAIFLKLAAWLETTAVAEAAA